MLAVKTYVNKILGDLPDQRTVHQRSEEFIKGDIRNDKTPNDSLADIVIAKLNRRDK